MKRFLSLLLTGTLLLSLSACGPKEPDSSSSAGGSSSAANSSVQKFDPAQALYALYTTTKTTQAAAMALDVSLLLDSGAPSKPYSGGLLDLEEDLTALPDNAIVLLPAGMAAQLYHQTGGEYTMLAITNLCGPKLVGKGTDLASLSQLRSQCVTYFYPDTDQLTILRHLLVENGLDADRNITLEQRDSRSTPLAEGIYLLDAADAFSVLQEDPDCSLLADLQQEWDDLCLGEIVSGCAIAKTQFITSHPEVVKAFLAGMGQSVSSAAGEEGDASPLLTACGASLVTGQDMKDLAENYYLSLFLADPDSIGGSLPYDNFYYGVN